MNKIDSSLLEIKPSIEKNKLTEETNTQIEAIEIKYTYQPAYLDDILSNNTEKVIYGKDSITHKNIRYEICCNACNKNFTTIYALKKHYAISTICVNWLSLDAQKKLL